MYRERALDDPALAAARQAVELLAARRNSLHEAHHEVMECLGEMIWASQRSGLPPDGHAYLDAVRRRATRAAGPIPPSAIGPNSALASSQSGLSITGS
eukprot:gene18086-24617_t